MWSQFHSRLAIAFILGSRLICAKNACAAGDGEFRKRSFAAAQELLWRCWETIGNANTAEVVYQLAQTFRELRNYEPGLNRLRREHPGSSDLDRLYLEGYLLFRMQEHQSSIMALHRGFKLNPADWRIHHMFALNFAVLGKQDAAIHEFQTAIRLQPKNAEVRYQFSRYYYTLNRFEAAIDEGKHAIGLAPGYVDAHSNLALCYQAIGQNEAALEEHETSVKLADESSASNEWPYLNYGEWLATQGDASKALSLAQRAIKAAPGSARAWALSGKVNLALRHFPEAKQALLEAVRLGPELPASYYQLSVVCRQMGDTECSKTYLQKFVIMKARTKSNQQLH